jgi:glutamyl-tRNA synthetase
MQPLRLALVGDLKGPDVFEIMSLLGKEEVCSRLARFQDRL